MTVTVHILHAFAHQGEGGNPAGVVLDADLLSPAQKQAVAAQVGLSETAFVSRSDVAAFRLEFFTPTRQIAHCGHATVAAFSYLRQVGRVPAGESSKETIDGCRRILLEGDEAYLEQRAPQYFVPHEVNAAAGIAAIAESLGLSTVSLSREHPPIVCSTGNRFLLVHLRDRSQLAALAPDMAKIAKLSATLDLVGYYAWTPDAGEFVATTRMFAPRYGIDEEAGTGMAAGPLAGYLRDRCGVAGNPLVIEQGAFMATPSPSRLTVRLETERMFVGGVARYGERREVPFMDR